MRRLVLAGVLNLVKSLTAGFDEPWALTAFLGKVIDCSQGRKVLMAEKNWPLGGKRKLVLSVGAGRLRRDAENYTGDRGARHGPAQDQFLLRPNLKF